MTTSQFDSYIADIVNVWLNRLQHKLQVAMTAEGLVDTGALRQSLRTQVYKNVLGATAQGKLDLNTYGRFLDIKRPRTMPTSSNNTNRIVTGVARKDRNRPFYNTTIYPAKFELADMLMRDVGKMSRADFLKWVQS